jgi:ketosteroid isomerase-like protein
MRGNKVDELMALGLRGWAALKDGKGAEFYGEMLADDAVVVVPGAVLDKQQALASWAGVAPWHWYDVVRREVMDLGDVAVLIYYVTARRSPEPPYHAIVCSTYARRPEAWRLIVHQQTPPTA